MKKIHILLILFLYNVISYGQIKEQINFNIEYEKSFTKDIKENSYELRFKKDFCYLITVKNKGINVEVELSDKNNKKLDKDYSYDKTDPAKISFTANITDNYTLNIKLKNDPKDSKFGNYSLEIKTAPKKLKKYKYSQLIEDFDILTNAYKETRVGLWYNNYSKFDSIISIQKSKIKDKMNAYDLYKILAPITSFTKEGHCKIRFSEELDLYSEQNFKYLPFVFKIINGKVYAINNYQKNQTKGLELLNINGNSIESIMEKFLNIHPSDGYNITGKFHRIERKFSIYYATFFENNPTEFSLEFSHPETKERNIFNIIKPINLNAFYDLEVKVKTDISNTNSNKITEIKIDSLQSLATISFNDFSLGSYKNGRTGFKKLLEEYFESITTNKIKTLVIDIRKNEGGEQGMEDHLLSYLIKKNYIKYQYVEIPSFDYTFLKYTQKSSLEKKENFTAELKEEFFLTKDGRYINKSNFYNGDKPNLNNFKGTLYILINGLTFSGGSEFASLAKIHTNAKFIGEETGGGFYGNSSGIHLNFNLPNTKLTGRIPICKFALKVDESSIPFGRGVIPDYKIQPTIEEYLNGTDAEMEFINKTLNKK